MRTIEAAKIIEAVEALCSGASFELPSDVLDSLRDAAYKESGVAQNILKEIIENAEIAAKEKIPLCQDTGTANFFINIGQNVKISGGNIYEAINKGVAKSYSENYLRKSIVSDPLERMNTVDNTPANIYINITDGDKIEIAFLPKGGGSENASALKMLKPSDGWQGVKDFIIESIKAKGANACPPLVIGVGIGGDFASVAKTAKKALLRKIGQRNSDPLYALKEKELLEEINNLNIGPMGIGGKTTALDVFIEIKPSHIASLAVAVSVQCHSCRRKTIII